MKITPAFITALLAQYATFRNDDINEWRSLTPYSLLARVRVEDRQYICSNAGISGVRSPVHTSGKFYDGTAEWLFMGRTTSSDSIAGNLYLGLGGPDKWKDESNPDSTDEWDEFSIVSKLSALLRLDSRNLCLGIERIEWKSGEIYPAWPNENSYVVVGTAVYRCINNNGNAPSTSTPTGTGILNSEMPDGYVWKFLGHIATDLEQSFGQAKVFPIKELHSDDGSERWLVQQSAKNGEISGYNILQQKGNFTTPDVKIIGNGTGAIARVDLEGTSIKRIISSSMGSGYTGNVYAVVGNGKPGSGAEVSLNITGGKITGFTIDSPGSGYTDGATGIIVGNGKNAECTVEITSGYVTGITITNQGQDYSDARLFIIPGDAGAVAVAAFAPNGGHGRNMVKELPTNYLLVSKRITSLDNEYLNGIEIRQLSLISGIPGNARRLAANITTPTQKIVADTSGAKVLYVDNIEHFTHSGAQDELVKFALKIK